MPPIVLSSDDEELEKVVVLKRPSSSSLFPAWTSIGSLGSRRTSSSRGGGVSLNTIEHNTMRYTSDISSPEGPLLKAPRKETTTSRPRRRIQLLEDSSDEDEKVNDDGCDIPTIVIDSSPDKIKQIQNNHDIIELDESEGEDEIIPLCLGDNSDTEDEALLELYQCKQVEKILSSCEQLAVKLKTKIATWGEEFNDVSDNCITLGELPMNSSMLSQEDLRVGSGFVLKAYQLVGINFLVLLHTLKLSGVLADEMGLGKTVQTICFLAHLKNIAASNGERAQPHLIIVPASVLDNWAIELRRFTPGLIVKKYYGSQDHRRELQHTLRNTPFDVLLTVYSYFEKDSSSSDRSFLKKFDFSYTILDEGHNIKNTESSRYRRITQVKSNFRLILSGTPVQNSAQDLLALLSFLMPKLFHSAHDALVSFFFNTTSTSKDAAEKKLRQILRPFVLRRLKRDVMTQLPEKRTEVLKFDMDTAQKELYTMVIQAAKDEKERLAQCARDAKKKKIGEKAVAKMIQTTMEVKVIPTSTTDMELTSTTAVDEKPTDDVDEKPTNAMYQVPTTVTDQKATSTVVGQKPTAAVELKPPSTVELKPTSTLTLKAEPTKVVRKTKKLPLTASRNVFFDLRKVANHPLLIQHEFNVPSRLASLAYHLDRCEAFGTQCTYDMVLKEISTYSDFKLHQLCMAYGDNPEVLKMQLSPQVLFQGAKMSQLKELMPKLQAEGHRVLLFSQWTSMLDLLESFVDYSGYRYMRLDGSTPVVERQSMIEQYQMDTTFFVFLLSTRAGGLGINLTAADTVIIHDLDFNPTFDEQACARCHRIGQTRPVTVYKLVSQDSVDYNIYKMGESKSAFSKNILGDAKKTALKDKNRMVDQIMTALLSE